MAEQKVECIWETLGPGVKVLRLKTSRGPKYPEVVTLELNSEEYAKFKDNPSSYINAKHIFSKDVQPGAKHIEVGAPTPKGNVNWLVPCIHTMHSEAGAVSAVAEESK